jgi:Cu+-exporting ATPase
MKKLLGLAPSQARRRNASGTEELVPIAELHVGDIVVLRPGERVPTDGKVIEAESSIDESMLTGESLPVDKAPGALVYGGTVNVNRVFTMQVTAMGEATALAQIIAAVERAQNSRANIQRLGDRVSSVFVPVVVLVAIVTALWWGLAFSSAAAVSGSLSNYLWHAIIPGSALAAAVVHCAAVLIIACPCAMGLATPAAIMAGTNAAAERGILIRDGIALEKAGTITAIVFDKTGTLTQGKPRLIDSVAMDSKSNALALGFEMARHSNHPLSQAIASGGPPQQQIHDSISQWQERSGSGIAARFQSNAARLGSLNWLAASGVDLLPGNIFIDRWQAESATIVGLAMDQRLAALFALRDELKPGAADVIKLLRESRNQLYLVTGDSRRTADAIARQLNLDSSNVAAEVRPEAKAEFVKSLQQRGERVAFIGDGINDAPALEQADLGIAVGRATDVAQMAADIVLLKSDVHAIPEALGLARATLRAIKQNLFWAFFYNALGIPLAALGFLSPVLCAAAMGLSDAVVIGNALRLRRWKP